MSSSTDSTHVHTELQHALSLWAHGDQPGALALTEKLFAEHMDQEQVVLTHSGLLLHREDFCQARDCLHQAAQHGPLSPALLANLSIALRGCDQLVDAIEVAKQAVAQAPEKVSAWNALGLGLMANEQYQQAEHVFREGLEQHNDHPMLKHHLNEALDKQGKGDESTKWSPMGDLFENAQVFSKEGNPAAAESMYRKAVHFNPNHFATHSQLGCFLMRFGRIEEARPILERAIELNPNCSTARHFLSLTYVEIPSRPDSAYIEQLFDNYAPKFDDHLVNDLRYNVPVVMSDLLLDRLSDAADSEILDLGCGTGLIGAQLQPKVRAIDGVDLSENMLDKAKEKRVYRALHRDDIRSFLANAEVQWDAMMAGDVFIYCGDIEDIVELAHKRLKPGGWLAFSVELCGGEGFTADPTTGRYQHSKAYLERLLEAQFIRSEFIPSVIRYNGGEPVDGWLVFAQSQ